jgi:antitoxin MazE
MLATVVQIGNSRGIKLPKNILRKLNIEDEVEMAIHNDELIIKSVERKPRQGWSEAFAKMSEAKEDKLLLPDNIDSAAFEWTW